MVYLFMQLTFYVYYIRFCCYVTLYKEIKVTYSSVIEHVSSYKIPTAFILNDAVISATSNRYDK